MTTTHNALLVAGLLVGVLGAGAAWAHGNVVPQAVETKGLTSIKDAGVPVNEDGWAAVNPYRNSPEHDKAVEIGSSAFNQNCAACHGLEAKSGASPGPAHAGCWERPVMNGLSSAYAMARCATAGYTCRRWPTT